jgi:type IV secretion system protein VirB4
MPSPAGRSAPFALRKGALVSLWPLAIGVGIAAGAAGMVAVPAVQQRAFGSVEFDWLAHQLELDRIDPDNITVRCKPRGPSLARRIMRRGRPAGTVMRVYRFVGETYDTKPEGQQIALQESRAIFRHAIAKLGVTARTFGVKRSQPIEHAATWPSSTLEEIGDAEAELYRSAYEVRWYMTLQAKNLDQLERADERVFALLSNYKPKRVSRPENREEHCPLTGFLNFLLCGDLRDDLLAKSSNISANVPAADLVFQRNGDLEVHAPTPMHHRILTVREWPDLVTGYLLHELLALHGEIEISEVSVPTSKERTLFELNRRSKAQFGSALAAEECAAATELLQQGKTSLVTNQMAIVLRAKSAAALDDLVAQASQILANRHVVYSVETAGAPVAWFNRMPDHEKLLRPLTLFVENVAALWPLEGAPTGLTRSQWGDAPVRIYQTGAGQAYAMQFQATSRDEALGNFLVVAPAGSGKSTLIMDLLGGVAKFAGVRSYVCDSKEGARFMVEAMGGLYQSFDKLELNPLDAEDTPINRQRLSMLIRAMLGDVGHTPGVEDILAHAVETAFTLPIDERTFNEIYPTCFPADTDAQRAFARWVTDDKEREGLYARIFNAPRDSLAGFLNQSFMVGINMNEALDDPVLAQPVVAHISNAIERLVKSERSRGYLLFIDEAAKLLANRTFADWIKEQYRECRKLRGAIGLAFQDPGALHAAGIADAVIENTATFFFFPNPQGNRAAYEVFNLNDEQKAFIFGGGHEGRRVLVVKRDAATGFEESVILNIDLAPRGAATRFYRSGPEAVRDLLNIQAKWGSEWLAHV